MNTPTLRLRRKPAVESPAPDEGEPTTTSLEWTGPAAMVTKVFSGILVTCLVAGPIALLLAAWLVWASATAPPASPVVSADTKTIAERAATSAFAEDFVVTWLTTPRGQEKRLGAFLSDYSNLTLPQTPWRTSAVATANLEATEEGWTVTVAVTVSTTAKDAGVRRFFQVPVIFADGDLAAQTLPTPVAGPQLAGTTRQDYRYRAQLDGPVSKAAGEFLSALLAGNGDVTRFITPGADIAAITPPPYTAVSIDEVAVDQETAQLEATPENGTRLQLLVDAIAAVDEAHEISVQYALTMTAREGRWEVSAIDPAPLLKPASTTPSVDEVEAPTPSPTAPESTPTTDTTH